MRFASLGSGSEGNALAVCAGQTCVLVDCGFSLRETERRLARLNLTASQLSGILVTHEHGDHIAGVSKLAKRHNLPVWITHGTLRAQRSAFERDVILTEIHPEESFSVGDIEVHPYSVPHDSIEPVQYVLFDGQHRLGVLTDAGHVTPHIESMLNGCDALVLECNHDAEMLARGNYPQSLKLRVGGHYGHLNNQQSAALLSKIDCARLQHLVAAHLSQRNNSPELAVRALSGALNCTEDWIAVATQTEGVGWRELV